MTTRKLQIGIGRRAGRCKQIIEMAHSQGFVVICASKTDAAKLRRLATRMKLNVSIDYVEPRSFPSHVTVSPADIMYQEDPYKALDRFSAMRFQTIDWEVKPEIWPDERSET